MNEWETKIFKEIVKIKESEDVYAANVLGIIKREINAAISEVRCDHTFLFNNKRQILEKRGI